MKTFRVWDSTPLPAVSALSSFYTRGGRKLIRSQNIFSKTATRWILRLFSLPRDTQTSRPSNRNAPHHPTHSTSLTHLVTVPRAGATVASTQYGVGTKPDAMEFMRP